ncbi:FeoB-associated Cys-rich membrane protein, partial [Enterococcus faecalis]
GNITYRRIKKGESCEVCQTACPVKKEQTSQE